MPCKSARMLAFLALLFVSQGIVAGVVSPNAGPVEGRGVLKDNDGGSGTWSVRAVLKNGNFTGEGTVSLGGASVSGSLLPGRSYVENGKCYFAFERDRARVALGGPCTTESIGGRLDAFIPGRGVIVGEMKGALRFGKAGAAPAQNGVLPRDTLTCAWWETRITYKAGELNGRELRFSHMGTLTLRADGTYRTAHAAGKFVREGNRVRLTSGAFGGAVGQLRPDRSGQPAVYFERDENKRPNGVHIVDPATTACTKARGN